MMTWIDPIALRLGPLAVHWYGIMYALGFVAGYSYFLFLAKKKYLKLEAQQIDTFMLYAFLGIVVGGRLGYILFYNLQYYLENPIKMLAVWDGGLSFHGGLVGVVLLGIYFCKKNKINVLLMADYTVAIAALGMFFGRIGNFINAELYGVPTNLPIGIVFPGTDEPRHPSQLYEAAKNLVFFLVTMPIVLRGKLQSKTYKPGLILWSFLLYYGVVRFCIEFVREPDPQLGYIGFGVLSMGQLFSIAMILVATVGFVRYAFGSKK